MKKIALLLALLVLISALGVSFSSAQETPLVISNVAWYSENSTVQPVPGMNNVPLILTFENSGPSIYNFTAYIYLKEPFSYGYVINNTQTTEKTVISLPEFTTGSKLEIMQLVNISPNARNGVYVENLFAYGKYSDSYPMENLSTTFFLPLDGNVNIFVASSYIGENGQILNPVPGENPVPFTIVIGNSGNEPVTNVTFTFNPKFPFNGNAHKSIITVIPEYGYVPLTFMVNFSKNVKNGNYLQKLQFSYYNVTGSTSFNFSWCENYSISVLGSYLGYNGNFINGIGGMKNIPLTLEISNSGTDYVSNVSFVYSPEYPFQGLTQKKHFPVLAPFQVETLAFIVSIENSTLDGIYNQTLKEIIGNNVSDVEFSVQINGYSNVIVDGSFLNISENIVPGPGMKDVPMSIIISNVGNTILTNVTFTFNPEYPLCGHEQVLNVPALPEYTPVTLTYIVNILNNASNGIYIQKIHYNFSGYNGTLKFSTSLLGYSNISIQGYYLNPSYVYTNQTFNAVTFSVINSGNSPAFNLTVQATSSMKIVNTPLNISILPPHMLVNYTVYYNSPSNPGIYYINFHFGKREISVPVNVIQSPMLLVKTNFPSLTPGDSKVQVTFYLDNKGPGTIQSMEVHFLYPEVLDLYVSSDNPLGGLFLNNVTLASVKPGENFTLPYIIDVADNAVPGKYSAELVFIIMENNTLRPILETFYFTFQISAPFFSTSGSSGILSLSNVTIIILVIIIIALVAMYIRQVRMKKS
ncbi:MAG: hypothetical protein ACP5SF_03520 [Thermoplasmata archaeon]